MSEATIIFLFGALLISALLGAVSIRLDPAVTGVFIAAGTMAVLSTAFLVI